jgi:hypothetical protein
MEKEYVDTNQDILPLADRVMEEEVWQVEGGRKKGSP